MKGCPGNIVIDAAGPENADTVRRLVYETDPHIYDCQFNSDAGLFRKCIMDWWQREDGWYSYHNGTTAVCDNSLVGIQIGFTQSVFRSNTRPAFQYARDIMPDMAYKHYSNICRNYMPFLIPPFPHDGYYIQNLSVSSEMQTKGVGAMLIEKALQRAAGQGFKSCHLDVYADNPAVEFYRRQGFKIHSETRVPYLEETYGVGVHYRMMIILDR
jgi:ribosomal protein S18 acetylase RimI-like enzyme